MSDKTTSKTERVGGNILDVLLNNDERYKTTITDGTRVVKKYGWTPEEAEENASDEWDDD